MFSPIDRKGYLLDSHCTLPKSSPQCSREISECVDEARGCAYYGKAGCETLHAYEKTTTATGIPCQAWDASGPHLVLDCKATLRPCLRKSFKIQCTKRRARAIAAATTVVDPGVTRRTRRFAGTTAIRLATSAVLQCPSRRFRQDDSCYQVRCMTQKEIVGR